MRQQILDPNEGELRWIEANLQAARSIINAYAPEHGEEITPAALDKAFSTWLAQHDPWQEDPNPYINAFGIAFGQYLADHLDLKWAVVKDRDGAEIAVHGQPGDILVFPPNLVSKRYTSRTTGFFESIYFGMEKDIPAMRRNDLATLTGRPPGKPWWKFWSTHN